VAVGRDITVRVEDLGEEYGFWCDACMLPSVVAVYVVVMVNDRPARFVQGKVCTDCNRQDLGRSTP
jgi:hypothetical protein